MKHAAVESRDTPEGKDVAPLRDDDEADDDSMQHLRLSLDGEDTPEVLAELKHMIAPDDFLRAVQSYLRDQEVPTESLVSSMATNIRQDDQEGKFFLIAAGKLHTPTNDSTENILFIAALRRAGKRTAAYWDALADVVSSDSVMVWKQLKNELEEYIRMLRGRRQLVNDVQSLAQQNVKLKEQLRAHLSDTRNQDLQVPPTHVRKQHLNEIHVSIP